MDRHYRGRLAQLKPQENAIRQKWRDDPKKAKERILQLRKENHVDPETLAAKSRPKKVFWIAVGLAAWYHFHPQPNSIPGVELRYPLPSQIVVKDSSAPYSIDSNGNRIVQVKDIDFSADTIDIQTDRYHFVKDEDWKPLWYLGQPLSLLPKLFFWDHNIGWGADAARTRALLAMVEGNKAIEPGITVRVNRSAPLTDLHRLFTDPVIKERNNFLARSTIGVLDVFVGGVKSKLVRGDYYNPYTRTAVVYSNVESIGAHEMGHDEDYRRFDRDWAYSLSRLFPPVMLYQEWRASQNAKGNMSEQDGWQFNRYLMPAFFTYVLAALAMTKAFLEKMEEHQEDMKWMRKE